MNRVLTGLMALTLFMLASRAHAEETAPQPKLDFGRHFAGMAGCIVIFDSENGMTVMFDQQRCAKRFLPCSTYKIPHALMALDAGVLDSGAKSTIDFDAIEGAQMLQRSGDDLYGVKTLRQAIEKSLVWYFQEIARRLGPEREAAYLQQFNYGNMDPSSDLTTFWLDGGGEGPYGSLAISAREQVSFLQHFYEGCLGTSPEALAAVKDCLRLEEAPGGLTLSGKTGAGRMPPSADGTEPNKLGWFVGYVERPGKAPVYFALNLEADSWEQAWDARKRISKLCLAELGYWVISE